MQNLSFYEDGNSLNNSGIFHRSSTQSISSLTRSSSAAQTRISREKMYSDAEHEDMMLFLKGIGYKEKRLVILTRLVKIVDANKELFSSDKADQKLKFEITNLSDLINSDGLEFGLNDSQTNHRIQFGLIQILGPNIEGVTPEWTSIEYAWKLDNPRFWTSIMIRIYKALNFKGYQPNNLSREDKGRFEGMLEDLQKILLMQSKPKPELIVQQLRDFKSLMSKLTYSLPETMLLRALRTLVGFISYPLPQKTLVLINDIIVNILKLERGAEDRSKVGTDDLNDSLKSIFKGNDAGYLYTVYTSTYFGVSNHEFNADEFIKGPFYNYTITGKKSSINEARKSFSIKDPQNNPLNKKFYKRLNFKDLTEDKLNEFREFRPYRGAKGEYQKYLIVGGLFEHNDCSVRSVRDRSYLRIKEFEGLLNKCKQYGIKVIIEFEMSIGVQYAAKKYRKRILQTSKHGEKSRMKYRITPRLSENMPKDHTKSVEFYCLNYSDYRNWELTIQEICLVLAQMREYVHGICIRDMQALPLVFQRDLTELGRKEYDGSWSYNELERLYGYLIRCDKVFYLGEIHPSFLKFLTSKLRLFSRDDPQFLVLNDIETLNEPIAEDVVSSMNKHGVVPMVRELVLDPTTRSHSRLNNRLVQIQSNLKRFRDWIQNDTDFIFSYDSSQSLTPVSIANIMTVLLKHSHCMYQNMDRLNVYTDEDFSTVNQSRYNYIYNKLSAVDIGNGDEALEGIMDIVISFQEQRAIQKIYGLYNRGDKLIFLNSTPTNQQVMVSLRLIVKSILNSKFKGRDPKDFFLDVNNLRMKTNRKYDVREVLENGLFLKFNSYEIKNLQFKIIEKQEYTLLEGIENSKRLIIHAMQKQIVVKNTFLFREIFNAPDNQVDLKPDQKIEMLDHLENLIDRTPKFVFENFFKVFAETKISTDLCKKFCTTLLSHQTNIKVPNFDPLTELVFVAPEYRGISRAGGIANMVADLAEQLVILGCKVSIITPYYHFNPKRQIDYLDTEYMFNIGIKLHDYVELGCHKMTLRGVTIYLLHHYSIFAHLYQEMDAAGTITQISAIGKGSLELLCKLKIQPSFIIGNDWFCALMPAYNKYGHFGDYFKDTTFFHIFHNLGVDYEGRIYPENQSYIYDDIHHLPREALVDPYWDDVIINPSRCALLSSNQWGTVSNTYKEEILHTSPLKYLLKAFKQPFGTSNGIERKNKRKKVNQMARLDSKEYLQKKYFEFDKLQKNVCLMSFIGRITKQKGIYFLLEVVEEILYENRKKKNIQFLIGGAAAKGDPYGYKCASKISYLRHKYPNHFWADTNLYFREGLYLNNGSDFGLVPSVFEPGGLVQEEFLVADTPVICSSTGGLKDTVVDIRADEDKGNGLLFTPMDKHGLKMAIYHALEVFQDRPRWEKLSKVCLPSVVDVNDSATCYLKEFLRLKNSVYVPTFVKPDSPPFNANQKIKKEYDIRLPRESHFRYEEGDVYINFVNGEKKVKMGYDEVKLAWRINAELYSNGEMNGGFQFWFEDSQNERFCNFLASVGFDDQGLLINIRKVR